MCGKEVLCKLFPALAFMIAPYGSNSAYRSSNHMWLLRAMLLLIGELPGFALDRRARKGTRHLRTEEGCESIKPIHLRRPAFPKDPHDFLVAGSD
jgi:hypothetical protein